MGKQFQKLRTNQVRGQKVHSYGGLPGGKLFQKLRTNQVWGQNVNTLLCGLPGGQTVPEAQEQSGVGSINILLWWSTCWANSSRSSGPIRCRGQ